MDVLDTTNVEIQVPDLALEDEDTGRKVYRVETAGREDFFVRLGGASFQVLDAAVGGVRIAIDKKTVVSEGSIFPDCELRLGEDIFAGLRGRIAYCTSVEDGDWVCGIDWVDVDPRVNRYMYTLIRQLRKEVFHNE